MQTAVTLRGLRREFGETVALDGVDLEVAPGTITALVGPNGAGKTTLLKAVAGLLSPTSGSVSVMGVDASSEPRRLHAMVGFLPDHFGIYEDLTPRQFLRYFARAYGLWEGSMDARIAEVLTEVGLLDRADALAEGLSRGMKQRLGVARTVLHSPALLLLDEPASGLDPASRRELQDLLKRYASRGTTVVVSSHILAELEEYCTHVAILDRGRLAHHGPASARAQGARARRFALRFATGTPPAALFAGKAGVSGATIRSASVEFDFEGDDAAAAALLKALVAEGHPVVEFQALREGLQDRYLSIVAERG